MSDNHDHVGAVILAAGMGTRMQSKKAKVLHKILGKAMIHYVVRTARRVCPGAVIVVVGHQAESVRREVLSCYDALFAVQPERLGTGHAVMCALPEIPEFVEQVLILNGDVPMLMAPTLIRMLNIHKLQKRDLTVLAVEMADPTGYGRILMDQEKNVIGIVEEVDATQAQKKIKIVNSGVYCVKKSFLLQALKFLQPSNVQGELYLTDILGIGYRKGYKIGATVSADTEEVQGINTQQALKKVEALMRLRLSESA